MEFVKLRKSWHLFYFSSITTVMAFPNSTSTQGGPETEGVCVSRPDDVCKWPTVYIYARNCGLYNDKKT
jgi:hypothetical protein